MKLEFEHIQAAHCENGVTVSLLRNAGVHQITEPLAFGLGAGLFFIYLPLLKINNGPVIAFRTFPGLIFKRTCKGLRIPITRRKFTSKLKATAFLEQCLNSGNPAGCQVGVYYLPYFPKEYRFHFNAHNIIVFGKEDGKYLISDPVMEKVTELTASQLERVRFAKGLLAPKGQVYYPKEKRIITDEQIAQGIINGVEKNIHNMLHIPGPMVGISGINFMGKKIKKWRIKFGLKQAGMNLAQLIRMQEEIGTGGGGFRYIYAAFLQEAFAYHPDPRLMDISGLFTKSGDLWRTVASHAAGIFKGKTTDQIYFDAIGDSLSEIAEIERAGFLALSKVKWKR